MIAHGASTMELMGTEDERKVRGGEGNRTERNGMKRIGGLDGVDGRGGEAKEGKGVGSEAGRKQGDGRGWCDGERYARLAQDRRGGLTHRAVEWW